MAERILIATHNKGKVAEFRDLLEPLGYEVVSADDLGLPEPDETGATFEANAELKALAAARAANVTAIADDSGLAVVGLDGAPGIYSARWAGESKDFTAAMARVANELEARGINPTGAAAYFVCALSLAQPDGTTQTLRGEVHGTLTFPARGAHGFGYDPIFIAEGMDDTFGEIPPDEKHAISHRARAFAQLLPLLSKERAA